MENVGEVVTEKEVLEVEARKDDRMVICSDGTVMSFRTVLHPRFSEDV